MHGSDLIRIYISDYIRMYVYGSDVRMGQIYGIDTSRFKRFCPFVLARFSEIVEQNVTDEPKVMKERGEIGLSTAILGRYLTV